MSTTRWRLFAGLLLAAMLLVMLSIEPEELEDPDQLGFGFPLDPIADPDYLSLGGSAATGQPSSLGTGQLSCTDVPAAGGFAVQLCFATDNCFRGVVRIQRTDAAACTTETNTSALSSTTDKYLRDRFAPDTLTALLEGPELYALLPSPTKLRSIWGDLADELTSWPWTTASGARNYRHPELDSGTSDWESPRKCRSELHFHLLAAGQFELSLTWRNRKHDGLRDQYDHHPDVQNVSLVSGHRVEVCPQLRHPAFNPHLAAPAAAPDCADVSGPLVGTWLRVESDEAVERVHADLVRDAVFVPYSCSHRHVDFRRDRTGRTTRFCPKRCSDAPTGPEKGRKSNAVSQSLLFEGDSQLRTMYEAFKTRIDPFGRGFVLNTPYRQYRLDKTELVGTVRADLWIDDMLSRMAFAARRLTNDTLAIPYAVANSSGPESDRFGRLWTSYTFFDTVVAGFGHWPAASTAHHGHWTHLFYLHALLSLVRTARRAVDVQNRWSRDRNRPARKEIDRLGPLRIFYADVQPISVAGSMRLHPIADWRLPDRMQLWSLWTQYVVATGGRCPPGIDEKALENLGPLPPFDPAPHNRSSFLLLNSHQRFLARLHRAPDGVHFSGAEIESLADELISKLRLCAHNRDRMKGRRKCTANLQYSPAAVDFAADGAILAEDWDPVAAGVDINGIVEKGAQDIMKWLDELKTGTTATPTGQVLQTVAPKSP
ncbi:hypothetical protein DFJ74DRAFT_765544 [Hyaloraphidium curvatum]|nr:hypothetical protein DFJ74DRAFT_765544 [Hyaloraphidium curvatum]